MVGRLVIDGEWGLCMIYACYWIVKVKEPSLLLKQGTDKLETVFYIF